MPTQFPSMLKPVEDMHPSQSMPGQFRPMIVDPPIEQQDQNWEQVITDKDERDFLAKDVDWDGEGFTRLVAR